MAPAVPRIPANGHIPATSNSELASLDAAKFVTMDDRANLEDGKEATLSFGSHETKITDGDKLGDGVKKLTPFQAYVRVFTYSSTTDRVLMGIALVAALASGTAMAMLNLVLGDFIAVLGDFSGGEFDMGNFLDSVSRYALYFVYLGIARIFLVYVFSLLSTLSAYRITRNIRRAYLRAALSQEIAFFDQGDSGAIAAQATSNGALIQAGISEKLAQVFQTLATFIACFVIAFVVHWKLTAIIICIVPAIVILVGIGAVFDARIESQVLNVHAQAGSYAEGVLASVRTVKAFGLRSRLVDSFDSYLTQALHLGLKKNVIYGFMIAVHYFTTYAGMGLAFWQGINMYARGDIDSIGTVFTVLMSVLIAASMLSSVAPNIMAFTRAATAAAQLFSLIDRESNINPFSVDGEKPDSVTGSVELRGVNFTYPARPGTKVLDDFSLHVPAGKVTALVGASGSGKSTIIGLLERWYNPSSGSITLDDIPIEKLNLRWLRTNVRLVQQEPILFNGTVFENIANGLVGTKWEDAPREKQLELAKLAAEVSFAHQFIMDLPQGYDTRIGERGGMLSGGQKQRIAIARSVVSSPKVLLLDEATSALDPHAEGVVQQALDRASAGRTTIVIAHKLATIRHASNIVVMSKGSIVEQGTHQSLLTINGTYAKLVEAQNLSPASSSENSDFSSDSQSEDGVLDGSFVSKSPTEPNTSDQRKLEVLGSRDDFDSHKFFGAVSAILRVIKAAPELKFHFSLLFASSILAAAQFPGQALLLGHVMSVFNYTGPQMVTQGNFFALMFFVMGIGIALVYCVLGYTSNTVLNRKFRKEIFNSILRQDVQFFDREENTLGALASRLESHPQAILDLMGINIIIIFVALVSVVGCSIMGIIISWKLGLVVVFAGVPPMLLGGIVRLRIDAKLDRDNSKRFSSSAAIASEAILAIRTVSSLAIEEHILFSYMNQLDEAVHESTIPLIHAMIWNSLAQSADYFVLALGFWWGSTLSSRGEVTFYQFIVSFMGTFFAGQSAGQIFGFSSNITKGVNATNYLFWLKGLQPLITETPENHDRVPKNDVEDISFEAVKFCYPLRSDQNVLQGINLKIEAGEFVAFVGASGCGKSTMIALVARYYDPISGTIRIDGEPLPGLNPHEYRKQLALVQQEPFLYPGSIHENISLGLPEVQATGTQIEVACRNANIWEFICSLPDGLQTPCGASGSKLSGGQRQRLAIARALIRDPKVLLLDEATSALDTES
ncbi:hypothetical protein G7Z17_g1775 [Cylindrodendrum hubeiense]|uniref:Uncharacterized protein n=1 Tax=Cylindrodendrum hubeiense TaxID=595255 RepID=A0A9P5HIR7_9HYPO|nr:hypothetical protein G7Z17_g1775 [Cylindrodendrum hubeiense]